MRRGSRAPRRARDPVTAWWPWGATCTCLEGLLYQLTVLEVRTYPDTVSHSGGADEHKHIETPMVHRGPCRG
jgi:hypothetical protein